MMNKTFFSNPQKLKWNVCMDIKEIFIYILSDSTDNQQVEVDIVSNIMNLNKEKLN